MDLLPKEVTRLLEEALVRRIERGEVSRAFRVATAGLLAETRRVDERLASRLESAVLEIGAGALPPRATSSSQEPFEARAQRVGKRALRSWPTWRRSGPARRRSWL